VCLDQFEYVMVLVSIIIGLGIAHQLLGTAGIVDRVAGGGRPLGLSVAYFSRLGVVFSWTVLFWWWEFRFSTVVTNWTVGLYFLLVIYAVVLFLLAALLVPRTWDPVEHLAQYFLDRRVGFYSLLLAANGVDVVDGYLKGGTSNLIETPAITYLIWIAITVASLTGLRARSIRVHGALGLVVLSLEIISGSGASPSLRSLTG
jgi:hypothetical protein